MLDMLSMTGNIVEVKNKINISDHLYPYLSSVLVKRYQLEILALLLPPYLLPIMLSNSTICCFYFRFPASAVFTHQHQDPLSHHRILDKFQIILYRNIP